MAELIEAMRKATFTQIQANVYATTGLEVSYERPTRSLIVGMEKISDDLKERLGLATDGLIRVAVSRRALVVDWDPAQRAAASRQQLISVQLCLGSCQELSVIFNWSALSYENGVCGYDAALRCASSLWTWLVGSRDLRFGRLRMVIGRFEVLGHNFAKLGIPYQPLWRDSVLYLDVPYLKLVRDIMEKGEMVNDRTGTGTKRLFGVTVRYDLSTDQLPLFTCKRVSHELAQRELRFFLNGGVDTTDLERVGVNFWMANTRRAILDAHGFTTRPEGSLGPSYGFCWRNFGAPFIEGVSPTGGIDQVLDNVAALAEDSSDTNCVTLAWDEKLVHLASLPPCHYAFQLVTRGAFLDCVLHQRSADMLLGVPFNVFEYALLTRLVANTLGLRAGTLIHAIGDAHIYKDHLRAAAELLQRPVIPSPAVSISMTLEEFMSSSDVIKIPSYVYNPAIKLPMSV